MAKDINMLVYAPHSFEVIDVRPIGSASLVQTRTRQGGSNGYRNTISLGGGLFASWASVQRAEPMDEEYDSNGSIKINLRIDGDSVISGKNHGPYAVTPMMCSALLQPKGRSKFERFEAGAHEKSVTISATREHLVEELGLSADSFDGALHAFLLGQPYEFTFLKADFNIALKQAADAFFDPDDGHFSLGLLLRSRAHDILRLFFEQMQIDHKHERRFRQPELDMIEKVKTLLIKSLDATLSTTEIATKVGSSASRLTRLFKAVEGRTISEYVTARRMARALDLMREGQLTITQIAFEVGYEHSANFSTAFRRHYGMTPRQAMQGIKSPQLDQ
ncbi:helix-turn-helix transcriptional regulator [Ruegeria pomeroyi]|nr:helix-turn-helix transcriptional regulator [Ruegeria pomeroyi]